MQEFFTFILIFRTSEKKFVFKFSFVDPDPHWWVCGSGLRKNAGSGSGLNQSGSTTLAEVQETHL
jgi:hypothetical protein